MWIPDLLQITRKDTFGSPSSGGKMILEEEMESNPHLASPCANKSISRVEAHDGRRIGVQEAARRLGVSKSTIYRIARTDGPFRFQTDGWRVFIDLTSFEAYLSKKGAVGAPPNKQANEEICQRGDQGESEETDAAPISVEPTASLLAPAIQSDRPLKYCGQRELLMPRRDQALFLVYMTLA